MKKYPSPPTLLCLACLSVLGPARAQERPADPGVAFELSRVVVKGATVGTLDARSLLTSVDTIGGAAVQDAAVANTWELFTRLPGMNLTNFNQGTTSGKVSMRGFNGEGEVNAVKLLIDGVPSNSNDGNMPYLDLVVPLGLQAITSVRGTNDARYGLYNIAGNLEMLTRLGGNANDARVSIGSWGKADVQLALDREDGGLTQNLTFGMRQADGWRAHSQADRTNLAGRWTYTPQGQDLNFGLALRAAQVRAQEPGYLTEADENTDPRQSYAISATDGGERAVGQAVLSVEGGQRSRLSWRALVWVNRFDDQRWVRFSAGASQQERDTDETHRGARAILSWRPKLAMLADFALESGIDTERQRNASQRYNTTERARVTTTRDQAWTLDVTGAFVQAVIKPVPTLKLVPGWRVDRVGGHFSNLLAQTQADTNDYGTISQPKFSAVWTPTDTLSAYANWGRTFQIGVGAASYKIPPRTSDLQPSINDGAELGVKLAGRIVDGRIAVWQQTATDEVYRDLNNPSGDSINIGATRRRGVDLQLRAHPTPGLDAFATLALQKATITEPNPAAPTTLGKEVDHVPRRIFNAGVDWQARADLKLSAWLQGQSDYWLERTNTLTGKYGAYRTLNLGATWSVSPQVQLDAQLLNANGGRREYVWWDGGQTLHSAGDPRSLYVALRASY
jgi:iron complex outermembrane recepter protein